VEVSSLRIVVDADHVACQRIIWGHRAGGPLRGTRRKQCLEPLLNGTLLGHTLVLLLLVKHYGLAEWLDFFEGQLGHLTGRFSLKSAN
jgi:hypothetical protein